MGANLDITEKLQNYINDFVSYEAMDRIKNIIEKTFLIKDQSFFFNISFIN